MVEWTARSSQEKFQHLLAVISSTRFLKMQSLNNEIPFYICPYKPQDAVEMERLQQQLRNKLDQSGIRVLNINLYDLSIDHLKSEGDWEFYVRNEPSMPKDDLLKELQSMLDVESVIIPAISAKMAEDEFDVMFICGGASFRNETEVGHRKVCVKRGRKMSAAVTHSRWLEDHWRSKGTN